LREEQEEMEEVVVVVEEGDGVVTMLVWDSHFSTRISILGDIPVNFFLATGERGGVGGNTNFITEGGRGYTNNQPEKEKGEINNLI